MKVGIYLGNFNLHEGGGFSFEESILEALLKDKSHHQYVLLSSSTLKKSFSGLEFVSLSEKVLLRILKRFVNYILKLFGAKPLPTLLNRAIAESHIDLVWFITPVFESVNCPYIYTLWDLDHRLFPFFPEVSQDGWLFEDREALYKTVLPKASVVITGTQAGKDEISYFYRVPEDHIEIIPLPFNEPVFPSLNINLDELGIKSSYVLYPAHFWAHKNHITILLALKELRDKQHIKLSAVFTGSDKGNKEYIKKMTEEFGLNDSVHFLGLVDSNTLAELYRQAFALVFPTFFGPDNLPPLEAFSYDCPVIASKVSGSKEQLGDAAMLFDPASEKELVVAIKKLWDNPELRQDLIKKGREQIKGRAAECYIQKINQVLDRFESYRRCWK